MNRKKPAQVSKGIVYLKVNVLLVGTMVTASLLGCSSAREANETADDPIEVSPPATIQTDEQRRQIYNQGAGVGGANADPLPKPGTINEKASDVNNKKNIEEGGTNKPGLTPTEVRPQVIKARTDTVPRLP